MGCSWGRTTHRMGRRPTTCSRPGNRLRPCLHMLRWTPCGQWLWGCEHGYALCTRHFCLRHALRDDLLLLRFGNIAAGSRGRTICCSSDCDAMLESADACWAGLAALSGDVVESTNYILKKGYNGQGSRG